MFGRNRKSELGADKKNEAEGPDWIAADGRLFDRSSIITMLCGLVLFMFGMGLDLATARYPEVAELLRACRSEVGQPCVTALHAFDIEVNGQSAFEWRGLLAETLKAVGLTIIAAVFISSTVDHRTRNYFFRQLSDRMRRLGSNVISGMFETTQPDRLFELIKRDILQKKIVRKTIDINYTLSDLKFEEGRLANRRFVKLDVILLTVTENVSSSRACDQGAVVMPIGLGLPNPMYDELKPLTRINGFRVGSTELTSEEIEALNAELQECLKDDNAVDAHVDVSACTIPFGGALTVSGSYTMIKEMEDTEVFRTAEIAENISLTVTDKSELGLVIRARSMGAGKLHFQSSPASKQWKLDDLSLPLQGIMVWWKQPLPPKVAVEPAPTPPISE